MTGGHLGEFEQSPSPSPFPLFLYIIVFPFLQFPFYPHLPSLRCPLFLPFLALCLMPLLLSFLLPPFLDPKLPPSPYFSPLPTACPLLWRPLFFLPNVTPHSVSLLPPTTPFFPFSVPFHLFHILSFSFISFLLLSLFLHPAFYFPFIIYLLLPVFVSSPSLHSSLLPCLSS